jgi:sugar lactone lactonase YvrE
MTSIFSQRANPLLTLATIAGRLPRRWRRTLLALLLPLAAATLTAQTFVAEWTAASEGRLGPTGMLVTNEGGTSFLYVSDQPHGRIVKFNASTGAVVALFGQQGFGPGELNSPYGLARDPASGDIYVAERGNNRVSRFTRGGAFVMTWGTSGTGPGEFVEPIGIAVDAAGDVYVGDHGNHRVQKFRVTRSGETWTASHVTMWGTLGAGPGQFNMPYGVTIDSAGNVWVADGFNGRVQRFSADGAYRSTLGVAGTQPGQFVVPTWVGIDANGDLLVTSTNSNPQDGTLPDGNSQWVSRFTVAGNFVSRWGGAYGEAGGQFRLPFGAVPGPGNRVFVADYYNSRVQVFDLSGSGAGAKVTGSGTEVGVNIVHPNGNVYDQVLLTGPSATVRADPGQITRISFIDLNDDIVQVEFSGAGTLTLSLENASGPARPVKYNQPNVSYMKGHASLAIVGANETTNLSVFSVGTATASNPALFPAGMSYDGIADIGFISISSSNGRFGGIRTANASYFRVSGMTGINAPGVSFTGPAFIGDLTADANATSVLIFSATAEVRVTGGDLLQLNSRAVQINGINQVNFAAGMKSNGQMLPALTNQARFERNGVDVTQEVAP